MPDKEIRPYTPTEIAVARPLLRVMSALNTWVYRLTGGRVGGKFLRGAPVMLLTTVGRKSGKARTTPLLYLEEEEQIVIVGSQGGMPKHPLWVLNLETNPECEVQVGSRTRKMNARRASDEEKAGWWPKLTAMYRDFDDYQARTDRNIRVFVLSPR